LCFFQGYLLEITSVQNTVVSVTSMTIHSIVLFQWQSNGNKPFRIKLQNGLRGIWEHPKTINAILKEERFADKIIKFASGRLSFKADAIENIFDIPVRETVEYVEKSLDNNVMQGTKIECIVVVGGFAMSGYVLEQIR